MQTLLKTSCDCYDHLSSIGCYTLHMESYLANYWRRFCLLITRVFYRRFEVSGLENLPENRGVILCCNHVNALADAVVIQASTTRLIRPLARSGLFKKPYLKPFLAIMGAVPVYRRKDPGVDVSQNKNSFGRVYELLDENEIIIIFPEGQSHDDPHLNEFKTGAARMALGAMHKNGKEPVVLPAGLNFSAKGKFRSDILVQYGVPVDLAYPDDAAEKHKVKDLTRRIKDGLTAVTLNADSWEDIDLVKRLERFFSLRGGKLHTGSMADRYRALRRLINAHQQLRTEESERIRSIVTQLKTFERLCKQCGIDDYHLTINYRPTLIVLYILRSLFILLVVVPIALWAWFNSVIPYIFTQKIAAKISKGPDQYDTSKMAAGIVLFTLFWGIQIWLVSQYIGNWWGLGYLLSLAVSSFVALKYRGEYGRIKENIKVFILFMRKQDLRQYLLNKREDLESELATLVRIAKRLSNKKQAKED